MMLKRQLICLVGVGVGVGIALVWWGESVSGQSTSSSSSGADGPSSLSWAFCVTARGDPRAHGNDGAWSASLYGILTTQPYSSQGQHGVFNTSRYQIISMTGSRQQTMQDGAPYYGVKSMNLVTGMTPNSHFLTIFSNSIFFGGNSGLLELEYYFNGSFVSFGNQNTTLTPWTLIDEQVYDDPPKMTAVGDNSFDGFYWFQPYSGQSFKCPIGVPDTTFYFQYTLYPVTNDSWSICASGSFTTTGYLLDSALTDPPRTAHQLLQVAGSRVFHPSPTAASIVQNFIGIGSETEFQNDQLLYVTPPFMDGQGHLILLLRFNSLTAIQ